VIDLAEQQETTQGPGIYNGAVTDAGQHHFAEASHGGSQRESDTEILD